MIEADTNRGYMPLAKTDKHGTPKWLLESIRKEFGPYFDPCPIDWDESKPDGLVIEWGPINYVNPPYNGSQWQDWVKKAFSEMDKGRKSIMLLPSRTGTKAFHNIILKECAEIRFFEGRLTFDGSDGPAVFDSILIIFDPFRPGPPLVKSIKRGIE
jgi:hypothetical protein